jgi:hypothetical protein
MFNYNELPPATRRKIRNSLIAYSIKWKTQKVKNYKCAMINEVHLLRFIALNEKSKHIGTLGTVKYFKGLLYGTRESL